MTPRELIEKWEQQSEEDCPENVSPDYHRGRVTECAVKAAELRAALPEQFHESEKYDELIMAVAKKYPGKTRHETALRYIQQAEEPNDEPERAAQENQP